MILTFEPYYKTVIWGGRRIGRFKNVDVPGDNVGESWEVSAVPGKESVVSAGPMKGKTLSEVVEEMGVDLLGEAVVERYGKEFPLLVKIIDAHKDLSLQVHPDDEMARRHGLECGKTEMWFVVDCEDDARIYTGLNKTLDKDQFQQRIADKTIMDDVAWYQASPGQFYYIPSGSLHAIGAGNLIVEVQQSADVTYRVYDYDRLDVNGNPRELHTEKATEAIKFTYPEVAEPTAHVYTQMALGIVRSPYFTVDFLNITRETNWALPPDRFTIVVVISGELTANDVELRAGHSALVSAHTPSLHLDGNAKLLLVHPEHPDEEWHPY